MLLCNIMLQCSTKIINTKNKENNFYTLLGHIVFINNCDPVLKSVLTSDLFTYYYYSYVFEPSTL